MDRHAIVVDGWPTLMSLDLALRYLSVDEATFCAVAEEFGVETIELRPDMPRWRKADLDRLIKRLPIRRGVAATRRQPAGLVISEAEIERLALVIARHLGSREPGQAPELLSIKDAARQLGLSRTTVYGLINEGRLKTRQIGRRRLVLRTAIEAIMAQHRLDA